MRLDQGQESENLEDRRGKGMQVAAIGGGGMLLILVLSLVFGVDPQMLLQNMPQQPAGPQEARELTPEEKEESKFYKTVLFFTEEVWNEQFRQAGQRYKAPRMVLFTAQVETGCGVAPSAVGPFYCPADETVYLDPTFFNELGGQLGGSKGQFSQAYVLAHEVGHHVQNLLGFSKIVDQKRRTLPKEEYNKWSVRLELQADYLAGVWAHYGQKKFKFIEPGDVEEAIRSANAIGDDRLQKRSTGFVSPENYTHGTSAQRVKWFNLGLKTGDLSQLEKIFEMPYGEL